MAQAALVSKTVGVQLRSVRQSAGARWQCAPPAARAGRRDPRRRRARTVEWTQNACAFEAPFGGEGALERCVLLEQVRNYVLPAM